MRQTADGGYLAAGGRASFGAGDDDFWILEPDWNGAIPDCQFAMTPAAVVADTQVTGIASQTTVKSSGAQAQTTHDTSLDTGAPVTIQCLAAIDCLGPLRITCTPPCYFPGLSGGYDYLYDLAPDNTRIEGSVTVRQGTLKFAHIAIRP